MTNIDPFKYTLSNNAELKIFLTDKNLFEQEVVSRLDKIAKYNNVHYPIIGLPDIHYKVGNFIPTGTVIATDSDYIIPCAVGNGAGCGYSLMKLSIKANKLSEKNIETIFKQMMDTIHTKKNPDLLSKKMLKSILTSGVDALNAPKEEKNKYSFSGNAFNQFTLIPDLDFSKYFPKENYQKGFCEMGVLGSGNHFIELIKVEKIYDIKIAKYFNIEAGDCFFFMHADANKISSITKTFTPYKTFKNLKRIKQEINKMKFHLSFFHHLNHYFKKDEIFSLKIKSKTANRFLSFINATTNYGFANRHSIYRELKRILSTQKIKLSLEMDTIHDFISFEDNKWIHRTGATIATPPSTNNPFGRLNVIPGALGTDSLLVCPTKRIKETYNSLNHGCGRLIDRSIATNYSIDSLYEDLQTNNIKLYRKNTFDISREYKAGFKDISSIKNNMEALGLVNVVAKFKPISIFKG